MNKQNASSVLREHEFWALKNVSFDLAQGETLAVIGRNGAGKSTLLRLLLGVYEPDEGLIRARGSVIAFMNIGTTFHQEYTGRENIMLSATTFGLKFSEIKARMNSIIEFSELGDFLDDPIKYYSRGMITKLGLAIAFHCRGDIILADEALSGGDAMFVQKCKEKIKELKESGSSIVLASHNLAMLESVCQKALWLEKGTVRAFGPLEAIFPQYTAPEKNG